MRQASVYFHPTMLDTRIDGGDDLSHSDTLVVVIDALRATTTIIRVFEAGGERIIPVSDLKTAQTLAGELHPRPLLCGERGGLRIEGFDFGNSPREFLGEDLRGRTLVQTTTNGTRAFVRVDDFSTVVAAAFINAGAVCEFICDHRHEFKELAVVCAGREGTFSLEDTCCAGLIISRLDGIFSEEMLCDSALAARSLYAGWRDDIPGMMRRAQGGQSLTAVGLEEDIDEASRIDSSHVLPFLKDGVLEVRD